MKIFSSQLFQLFILTVCSASIDISNVAIIQSSILNLTAGLTALPDVPVDSRYDNQVAFQSPAPLDQNSLLAAATDTMGKLATRDFYGSIGNFQTTGVQVNDFSKISIQFKVSAPGQTVYTRIAVWALYDLVTSIALSGSYHQIGMRIYWNNLQVATLKILPRTSSQLTLEQQSISSLNGTIDIVYSRSPDSVSTTSMQDLPEISNTSDILIVGDLRLECFYLNNARDLSVSEILGAVMAGLQGVAVVDQSLPTGTAFKAGTEGIDSQVSFTGTIFDTNHPTYKYSAAIATLRAMPLWLLRQDRSAEMTCGMIIDGLWAGVGSLEKSD